MSDDPKEKEASAPAVEHKEEPERGPDNTVPLVPYDNSSNMAAIFAHWRPNAAALDINNQVFPPLLAGVGPANRGKVKYLDFGFTSAREYWDEVVLPAYECFKSNPSRGSAIIASFPVWHIQDWVWHEKHPGEDTRNSKGYTQFQDNLFNDCPELPWIRDVADAGKHRGLGRPTLKVREMTNTWPRNTTPLTIKLNDGTEHDLADVLSRVIEYWKREHFT